MNLQTTQAQAAGGSEPLLGLWEAAESQLKQSREKTSASSLAVKGEDSWPAAFSEEINAEGRIIRTPVFGSLIRETLSKFAVLQNGAIDREIVETLRRISELLGLQKAKVWWNGGAGPIALTHYWPANDESVLPGRELEPSFPWLAGRALKGEVTAYSQLKELPEDAGKDKELLLREGTRSMAAFPLQLDGAVAGVVSFETATHEMEWRPLLLEKLELVSTLVAQAVARKLLEMKLAEEHRRAEETMLKCSAEIRELKQRLLIESDLFRAESTMNKGHGQIIGRSRGIKRVLRQVEQVAPVNSPVLITGETGTGKELIAQEIHSLSSCKDRVMVLVNCAALPSALVESELFGRERGAYTGALTSQVGRFEIADGSTIFLDEVGELSMEVQAKLLRVLQQGEFQRLGSPKTHKVNVRVIAATNRDLAEEVRKGRCREDLYYRLKVFPIDIPPLRDRAEDIPLLVFAFMEEFSSRMGKKVTKIPRKAMELLQGHAWPGNIRELRNVIERSVILTAGDTLKLSVLGEAPSRDAHPVTLAQAEREHILKTLESTEWTIKGSHGAAARLGLQPSTLYSRMQKLGIPHRRQRYEMAEHA